MAIRFSSLVSEQRIILPFDVVTKTDAIEKLVHIIAQQNLITNPDEVLRCALERESKGSTGIGKGVAVPHTKGPAIKQLVVSLGICSTGIDWDAVDGEFCQIIFFMAAPVGASGPHIQSLASLAKLLKLTDLRDLILTATTSQQVYDAILQEEAVMLGDTRQED